jgi:hypothetical protein
LLRLKLTKEWSARPTRLVLILRRDKGAGELGTPRSKILGQTRSTAVYGVHSVAHCGYS